MRGGSKKTRGGKRAVAAARKDAPEHIELDEVDSFHEKRDRQRGNALAAQSDSEDDALLDTMGQEVFAMDGSDASDDLEDDEDYQEYLKKLPGLRKQLGSLEKEEQADSEDGSQEDDELDVMAWGKRKSMYYNDDAEMDDEAAKEEEQEILRLQQERAKQMTEEDYLDDAFAVTLQGSAPTATTSSAASKKTIQQLNEAESDREDQEDADEDEHIPKDFSHLSREELVQHIERESPEFFELLGELKAKLDEVHDHVLPLLERVRSGQVPMGKGVSLLEVKNQLLLNYCMNLSFYFYLKADGKRVRDHPVIEKLVEHRLFLEKLKPIEQKMKYQIDKLVSAAANNGQAGSGADALAYRPNPNALVAAGADEAAAADSDEQDAADAEGIYRAPRIAPVHFEEDPGAEDRRRKAAARARKQASSSRLMKDLMEEVTEMPEEVVDAGNMLVNAKHKDKEWEDRIRAEEEMMTRLPVSRQDKKKMKIQAKFANELENLEDFGDLSYLKDLDADKDAEEMDAFKKRKSLRSIIRGGLQDTNEEGDNRKRKSGGDDDVPYRDRKAVRSATAGEDYNKHLDDDNEDHGHGMEDDAFYTAAQSAKYARKKQRGEEYQGRVNSAFESSAAFEEGQLVQSAEDKRSINYQILKNKGLTPARKKEQRNPRVKHRKKYEKSLIKLKSFKAVAKDPSQMSSGYRGEETGIKKNLARSVKF